MSEYLLTFFEPLKAVNPIIYTIIIAFVPLIELRGSIPVAIAMGLAPLEALLWSVVGSILPAFFVIPLFSWGLNFLQEKGWFPRLTAWLNKKFGSKAETVSAQQQAVDKDENKSNFRRELIKFWSIAVFVAIPLPGTGVWTGSAIASIIKMPFAKAFPAVLLGDIIAGIIVTLISVGVQAGWNAFF